MGGLDHSSCPNRWGILTFLKIISANAQPFSGAGLHLLVRYLWITVHAGNTS